MDQQKKDFALSYSLSFTQASQKFCSILEMLGTIQ